MRDQYAGDISDYIKFSYLRRLLGPEDTLGIGWYYLKDHDGRQDGRHREYLNASEWRELDPQLYDNIKSVDSVSALQQSRIWNCHTIFYDEVVPPSNARQNWTTRMLQELASATFIFVDPDNGISKDGKVSRKSAKLDEIKRLCSGNRPLVTIRFPHRLSKHDLQLAELHEGFASYKPIALRTTVRVPNHRTGTSPRIRWFTLLNGTDGLRNQTLDFREQLDQMPGTKALIAE